MLNKLVGRVLYSNLPTWQQRRLANTTLMVTLAAIVFAAILGAAMYWLNAKHS